MKSLRMIVLVLLSVGTVMAQPREGKRTELSLSGCYQRYSSGSSESSGAFLLSPRIGFFVMKGLEIEPELVFMAASGSDPVYVLNGNVSYNFIAGGKAVPFVLLGYGMANTVPLFGVPMFRNDFSVGVFNIGAGVKGFLTEDIALRIEYRYQRYSGHGETVTGGYYSYSPEVDMRIHTVQFGLSVLL
jgi:opacity protein-like surface antigen